MYVPGVILKPSANTFSRYTIAKTCPRRRIRRKTTSSRKPEAPEKSSLLDACFPSITRGEYPRSTYVSRINVDNIPLSLPLCASFVSVHAGGGSEIQKRRSILFGFDENVLGLLDLNFLPVFPCRNTVPVIQPTYDIMGYHNLARW